MDKKKADEPSLRGELLTLALTLLAVAVGVAVIAVLVTAGPGGLFDFLDTVGGWFSTGP